MLANHHITKPVFIGEIRGDGQFDVVWKTPDLVPGRRLVAASRRLARPAGGLGQAEMRQLQHRHQAVRRLIALPSATAGGAMPPALCRGIFDALPVAPSLAVVCRHAVGRACRCERPRRRRTSTARCRASLTDNFADTDTAVAAIAQSGSPLAIPLIEALQDGRLLFSAQAEEGLHAGPRGRGARRRHRQAGRVGPRPTSAPVRVNNRVRRAIDAAMGSLTLMSPDPATPPGSRAGGVQIQGCRMRWKRWSRRSRKRPSRPSGAR